MSCIGGLDGVGAFDGGGGFGCVGAFKGVGAFDGVRECCTPECCIPPIFIFIIGGRRRTNTMPPHGVRVS